MAKSTVKISRGLVRQAFYIAGAQMSLQAQVEFAIHGKSELYHDLHRRAEEMTHYGDVVDNPEAVGTIELFGG